jgi:hypothetical protein
VAEAQIDASYRVMSSILPQQNNFTKNFTFSRANLRRNFA